MNSAFTPALQISLQFLLILVLFLVGPLVSYFYELPMLKRIASSAQRISFYRSTVIMEWALAASALALGRTAILAAPPLGALPVWARLLLGCVLAVFFVLALLPCLQSLRGERFRQAYERAYRRTLGAIAGMLPQSGAERIWFAAVSITAGVCEEILFRGFLMRSLHGSAFHLPLAVALLLSSLIFGLNHLYQGAAGLLRTGIAGLAFGALFLLTGSLLIPILLHIALDMQALLVLRRQPAVPGNPSPHLPASQHPSTLPS